MKAPAPSAGLIWHNFSPRCCVGDVRVGEMAHSPRPYESAPPPRRVQVLKSPGPDPSLLTVMFASLRNVRRGTVGTFNRAHLLRHPFPQWVVGARLNFFFLLSIVQFFASAPHQVVLYHFSICLPTARFVLGCLGWRIDAWGDEIQFSLHKIAWWHLCSFSSWCTVLSRSLENRSLEFYRFEGAVMA